MSTEDTPQTTGEPEPKPPPLTISQAVAKVIVFPIELAEFIITAFVLLILWLWNSITP